jgi:AAA domain-containing protein
MTFTFRPAIRENVALLIGLAGASGSGKTYTAMRLARGIAGDAPFCVIDTEAGRAKHYADIFQFDHGDLTPPFTPGRYADAIAAADAAKYPVIVVDSASHEHAGQGGILDMQEAEMKHMAGDDWKRREAVKMASWVKPKGEHRKMVSRLLQVRAHLILCFRAEEKIEMVRGADNKMEVRKKQTATGLDGWVPIAEKTLPYELTASFLLLPARPGVPLPIKLQEQHRALFPLDEPITEESGRRLAEWARGGASAVPVPPGLAQGPAPAKGAPSSPRAESTAATAAPDLDAERKAWLEKVVNAENAMNMKSADRLALWRKHAGDAKEQNVDPSQLEAMFNDLNNRPGAAA